MSWSGHYVSYSCWQPIPGSPISCDHSLDQKWTCSNGTWKVAFSRFCKSYPALQSPFHISLVEFSPTGEMWLYVPMVLVLTASTQSICSLLQSKGICLLLGTTLALKNLSPSDHASGSHRISVRSSQRCHSQYQYPLLRNLVSFNLGPPATPSNKSTAPATFPYLIEGCAEFTGNLVFALEVALQAMEPALQDLGNGNRSPIFRAMFKFGSTKNFIRGILQKIVSHRRVRNLVPYPNIPTTPNFACVTQYPLDIYKLLGFDVYETCMKPGAGVAFTVSGISYIFICPSFWAMPPGPSFPDCPSVRRNQWVGPGVFLANYQSYLLIHEMMHFYLEDDGGSLGIHTHPPETYRINDCVGLPSSLSLHNPQNYQYYIACRLHYFTTKRLRSKTDINQ